ncbi:MAG: YggS family pyridoxal phosphate-dependent enzyme [Candidatus Acetothermia bacterium]|jgi:pyridoxal phosphate enzyme (YggS family)|nr:YggS family pyridoxal phosphate-dependent enzyme [Candidatus Acetothermia bacterium]MDH7506068.1 YggS family pyridoxal phosphate-dependent enzyme [Candidatus Acetothermia bacterium]
MIAENVRRLLAELPAEVTLVVAGKGRTPRELLEAVEAGAKIIGENYVQEAEEAFAAIGRRVKWHMIGPLQRNKAKRAVELFDLIETVDSVALAAELEKRCARLGRKMPILIEINSGREPQKAGVLPEEAEALIRQVARFEHLRVQGLMTMGLRFGDPEGARPYFRETRRLFEELRALSLPNVEMKFLSMGMSNTYKVAVEEGANIVRIGTMIFG